MWRRNDEAGFTGPQRKVGPPSGSYHQISVQPHEVGSYSQKGLRTELPHGVMRSLSLQVTPTEGGTEKMQALTMIFESLLPYGNKLAKGNQDPEKAKSLFHH